MKTIKYILAWIYTICVIVCPISFILTFVGLLVLNADLSAYSFLTTLVTSGYAFFYGTGGPRFNT